MSKGKLTFFCGKMAAGKSTLSKRIAQEQNAVLLSEDEWLESLYPNKVKTLAHYIEFSNLLKPLVKKHVQLILSTGTNVVMDFPANTVSPRAWIKSIYTEINASHSLIYINVDNEKCLRNLEKRRAEQPKRMKTDTIEMFEQVTQYFVEPQTEEGFNITVTNN